MELSKPLKTRISVSATIILAVIIAYFTLIPAKMLPALNVSDKVEHMLAFGSLVLPIGLLRPSRIWHVAALAVLFGGLIEVVQPLSGRHREFGDLFADMLGIALATVFCLIVRALRANRARELSTAS